MKHQAIVLSVLLIFISSLAGCEVVGGIFKAGMVWGIFLVVLVIIGIIFLISRGGRK